MLVLRYYFINMTSGSGNLDALVKEYLVFRGFIQSAKHFDTELKADKDKGFRADLIVEQLISFITSYDLHSLKDYWTYLNSRVFSRLELRYHDSTKRLYFDVLKYYVVHAVSNNRHEKVSEFFSKLAVELQQHPEWKDWFALPFIRNPEANEVFSIYFNKTWQDAIQLSLFNYISIIFQSMPTPALLDVKSPTSATGHKVEEQRKTSKAALLRGSTDLVDDFYTLTQSITLEDPNLLKPKKSIVAKGIAKVKGQHSALASRTKAKTFTSTTSTSAPPATGGAHGLDVSRTSSMVSSSDVPSTSAAAKAKRLSAADHQEMRQELFASSNNRSSHAATSTATSYSDSPSSSREDNSASDITLSTADADFMVSGYHAYNEHSNSVTHAKFSPSGNIIASADIDGVVKVWTKTAIPSTIATVISKNHVLSLEFADKSDNLLLIGSKPGSVKTFELTTKRSLREILITEEVSNTKLSDMSVDEFGSSFACSTLVNGTTSGSISTWDTESGEKEFAHEDEAIQSVQYFDNGNRLLLGCVNGTLKILDIREGKITRVWKAHSGKIYCMQLSHDYQSCYTMDSDNIVSQWSLVSGRLVQSFPVHDGAAGPYVFSPTPNHRQIQTPKDKIFSLNATNTHFLTCHKNSAIIYKIIDGEAKANMVLGVHRAPVVSVDWAYGETDTCLTADMLGHIKLSTLL
ncbi:WDR91 [Bugula neritina]|uniref:WD repeat-containing protein 91 n=1 Tax=Bugula neritina TaxID=10212 RepID=A0A7J7J0S7_BUGNE|nr:WDR91 [Bugula neritina]